MTADRESLRRLIGKQIDRAMSIVGSTVPAGSRVRPLLHRIRERLPTAVEPEPLAFLLAEFARLYSEVFFIQIGANDGDKNDHLNAYIQRYRWSGILVEPIPYVFSRLVDRHTANTDLALVNAAIAHEDGTARIYYLPRDDDPRLPVWYDQLATFRKDVLLKHSDRIPDIDSRVASMDVTALTFESLCQAYGVEGIDLIQIDTEGYDFEVIKQIDLQKHRPRVLFYEHYHLAPDDRDACESLLTVNGYRLISNLMDTLCIRDESDDERNRELIRLMSKLGSGTA